MNRKSLAFMAAGNLAAAMYCERNQARQSRRKISDESVDWSQTTQVYPGSVKSSCPLQPLKTFFPGPEKLKSILRWLYKASDGELTTCKIGLATAGNGLVSWSYRTRIEKKDSSIIFTGRFTDLPPQSNFSKIVLTMANGDEIARRALERPIQVKNDDDFVSVNYTLRFM